MTTPEDQASPCEEGASELPSAAPLLPSSDWDNIGTLILQNAQMGISTFITGKAGVGKTTLLRAVIERLRQTYGPSAVRVAASTGVAALQHDGGVTLHSLLRLPITPAGDAALQQQFRHQSKITVDNIAGCRVLVVDEVSMLSAFVIDMVDMALRVYTRNDVPMGGIVVMWIGDFLQLPPVFDTKPGSDPRLAQMAFESEAWKMSNIHTIILSKTHRQDEPHFVNMLNRIRQGAPVAGLLEVQNIIRGMIARWGKDGKHIVDKTRVDLFVSRDEVFAKNDLAFGALMQQHPLPKCVTHRASFPLSRPMDPAPELLRRMVFETLHATEKNTHNDRLIVQRFAVGQRVMHVVNQSILGLVNGDIGTVTHVQELPLKISVHFDRLDAVVDIVLYKWARERMDRSHDKCHHGKFPTAECFVSVQAIPLISAWALTIHKTQGVTFHNNPVCIHMRGALQPGSLYVALSRARSADQIALDGMWPACIPVNARAKEWWISLFQQLVDLKLHDSANGGVVGGWACVPPRVPFTSQPPQRLLSLAQPKSTATVQTKGVLSAAFKDWCTQTHAGQFPTFEEEHALWRDEVEPLLHAIEKRYALVKSGTKRKRSAFRENLAVWCKKPRAGDVVS